jgi:uncharacterized damage-inducible protein DinB
MIEFARVFSIVNAGHKTVNSLQNDSTDWRGYMTKSKPLTTEPWLRGTFTDVKAVPRGVLHALQLAQEDLEKWCRPLTEEQLNARPAELPAVAFHLRHIARSMDRLLSYAEGNPLAVAQLTELKAEPEPSAPGKVIFEELNTAFRRSSERVRALAGANLEVTRKVGRKQLPSTLGGLLVHMAEHTQRHVGQAITTAKVVARLYGVAS